MLEKIDLSKKSGQGDLQTGDGAGGGGTAARLQRECKAAGIPVMIVFEGMGRQARACRSTG